MESIVKPYLFRASLSAAIALILGILLSLAIYISSDLMRKNNIDLVENSIPVLTSINQVIADISEQERIIAEYYLTQNAQQFHSAFDQNKKTIFLHSLELSKHASFAVNFSHIRVQQEQIEVLSNEFDSTMQTNEIDWDKLRTLLAKISNIRANMLPVLQDIEKKTKHVVDVGHQQLLSQLNFTHKMVIIYGFSIVFLAIIMAWHIRKYVITNAENTRLALFPKFNPNPILSVNNLGELIFCNPACTALLKKVGKKSKDINQLIPINFANIRKQLSQQKTKTLNIEQMLADHVLQVTINWLAELDAYDIHIVDITERKRAEQKVNYLAFYVQETGLPNQYKLTNDVECMISKQQRFSLGLFQIRNYSHLVTAHGVEAIAELTRVLAGIIAKNIPKKSYLYHLNQNQFALLCSELTSAMLLEQLIADIGMSSEKAVNTECGEFFVELDFGFALSPTHGNNFSTLYKNAHTALDIAAADKYHNSIVFNENYAEPLKNKANMADNLRSALKNKELFLVFQPQLDLLSKQISGIETLVRWRHQGKVISPMDFIPLAEQSGLIVPIGQWILEQACFFAKNLVETGYQNIVVAVNVSPRQFSHPDFVQSVVDVLALTKLPSQNLELEITEGVFMHNEHEMLSVLNQLKALGLQLSIDDFGTGYSSLSYLKKFPIDKLKIDQSFIRDCHENDDDKALVKTIITLGKSLGMSLIAEGVEEYQHLTFLQSLHCDEIQGYWFSKPLLAEDLVIFLTQNEQKLHSISS